MLAPWLEGAPGRQRGEGRDRAFDGGQRLRAIGGERGDGAQQALRVGMRGGGEDCGFGCEFDQASGIHHGYPVGDRDIRQRSGGFAQVTGLPSDMIESQSDTAINLFVLSSARPELVPTVVTVPAAGSVGQSITVTWQVQNQEHDGRVRVVARQRVLSATPAITSQSILSGCRP